MPVITISVLPLLIFNHLVQNLNTSWSNADDAASRSETRPGSSQMRDIFQILPSFDYSNSTNSDEEFDEGNVCLTHEMLLFLMNSTSGLSPLDSTTMKVVFSLLYCLIWLAAVLSNGLVVAVIVTTFVVSRRRRPKCIINESSIRRRREGQRRDRVYFGPNTHFFSVQTVFVLSLACSDLLTAMTSLPVTAITIFSGEWLFPAFMCKLISFLQGVAILQSSFTYTIIAIDRYILVAHPNSLVTTYRSARTSVVATAILAALLSSPMYVFMTVIELPPLCGQFCIEEWPSDTFTRTYSLFVAIVQFGLPIVATTVCYVAIAYSLKQRHNALRLDRHLRRRRGADADLSTTSYCTTAAGSAADQSGTVPQRAQIRSPAERRLAVRRRRTTRMMAAMVAAFAILWFPFVLISVTKDFDPHEEIFDISTYKILFTTGHLIAMSTLVWNPVIYAWFNRKIRAALKSFLWASACTCFRRRRQ